ncbi:DNA cytosine methyltransferase [Novosphingobium sp. P6W]|uniref:DNA cytosine methyltransferase n=1 Tax=Novosphingobium sp. P6W TaxID=1609758 RepID=UPI0005C30429|nr:DNA cytosine methyltransferase [Novosphingobium sp. P6W]AXB75906.1 DNA (cytosine-5-)-methyltransferase [Novosphingobium sp. P6W]KIS32898.1 multidrug DMT transporter [Novosphingobium sp. P6W]
MRNLELFAGAGGLAMGMSRAGFEQAAVIERDRAACSTFRINQRHHMSLVEDWPIFEMDAKDFDYDPYKGHIDLISGGPPCQPFSMGGKHKSHNDDRDMFPLAIKAVRDVHPKAFIFENVRGLTRKSFSNYLAYILLQLQHPEISRNDDEEIYDHQIRLEKEHTASRMAPTYNVIYNVINAADFGIPQKRERVFFVGFRSDLGISWSFPEPTHSSDVLSYEKFVTRQYWDEHRLFNREQISSEAIQALVRRLEAKCTHPRRRWRTVRDALVGLPDPQDRMAPLVANHVFTPGARAYPGHTGSRLDEPAKTLKAGQHGVPGGENMFVQDCGGVRYFTIREAARMQTFPDNYTFHGSWSESMRQLGNAVPVQLAEVMAVSIAAALRATVGNY